jgi:hypothetical protein
MSMSQSTGPPPQPGPRINILAFPSPFTVRSLVLIFAVLGIGLFVGIWLHTVVTGTGWGRLIIECEATVDAESRSNAARSLIAHSDAVQRCLAPQTRQRALWAVGGAATVAGAGILMMCLLSRMAHRRHQRSPAASDPASLRGPDGALSWLARGVWYLVGPVLLVPVAWKIANGDYSWSGDYLWRAALLGIAVEAASAGVLRARDHEADIASARDPTGLTRMRSYLNELQDGPAGRWRWRSVRHPTVALRRHVVEFPQLAARFRMPEAATAAFVAALSGPLIVGVLLPLLSGWGVILPAGIAAAGLTGCLLGASVGLPLWRSAVAKVATTESAGAPDAAPAPTPDRITSVASVSVGSVAAGMAIGVVLGHVVSLSQVLVSPTGVQLTSVNQAAWLVFPVVLAAGAVVFSASLGSAWAEAAPLLSHSWKLWGTALLANSVIFATAAWLWDILQHAFGRLGWLGARAWLPAGLGEPLLLLAVLAVVASAGGGVFLRSVSRGRTLPDWLFETPSRFRGPLPAVRAGIRESLAGTVIRGLVTGAAVTCLLPLWRLVAGGAATGAEEELRFWTAVWICASVSATFTAVGGFLGGGPGVVAGMVSGWVSTATSVAGFLIFTVAVGGTLTLGLAAQAVGPAIGLGFPLALIGTLVGMLGALRPVGRWDVGALTDRQEITARRHLIATGSAIVAGVVIIAAGPALVGLKSDLAAITNGNRQPSLSAAEAAEVEKYANEIAPRYAAAWTASQSDAEVAGNLAATDPPGAAAHLESTVIPALSALGGDISSFSARSDELAVLHAELLAGVRLTEEEYKLIAQAIRDNDRQSWSRALELRSRVAILLSSWVTGIGVLQEASTQDPQSQAG